MSIIRNIFLNFILLVTVFPAQAQNIDMDINAVYDESKGDSDGIAHNSSYQSCAANASCADGDPAFSGNAVTKIMPFKTYTSTKSFSMARIQGNAKSAFTFKHLGTGEERTARLLIGSAYADLKLQSPKDARGKGHKFINGGSAVNIRDYSNDEKGFTWRGYDVFAEAKPGGNAEVAVRFINQVRMGYKYQSVGIVYSLVLDNPSDWRAGDYKAISNTAQTVTWENGLMRLGNLNINLKVNRKLDIQKDKKTMNANLSWLTPKASQEIQFTVMSGHVKLSLQVQCATDKSFPGACVLKNKQNSDLIIPAYVQFQRKSSAPYSPLEPNGKSLDIDFPPSSRHFLLSNIEVRYEAPDGKTPIPGAYHGIVNYVFNSSV